MSGSGHNLSEVIADGRWLAHRYDRQTDAIQFRFVDREQHRELAFLKGAELRDLPTAAFPRTAAVEATRALDLPAPRFIFHSAYCCSTLLARAFDIPGVSMGMSEPELLIDPVELQLDRADPRQAAAVLDAALTLLARPIAPGEINVIKPSNVVNPFIRTILAMRPETRCVLLYAPLESLVASIASKDIEGRDWARTLMWKLIRMGQIARFHLSEEELYRQSDLQAAATGWLAQQALFAELAASPQVRTLESEVLLARPADAMRALKAHFEIDFDPAAVARGPAFKRHGKEGGAYDADRRRSAKEERLAAYRREIDMVMEWARRLADFAEVPRIVPAPLIEGAARPAF